MIVAIDVRVLFILRRRDFYYSSDTATTIRSSGLKNSAAFVAKAMALIGFETKVVEVTDNNDIDREVTAFKPTHVIIEAFWVIPSKFDVLRLLHPTVVWCVRNHSEIPFLSIDGVALGWTIDYIRNFVPLSSNSPRATAEIRLVGEVATRMTRSTLRDLTPYLPNVYVWPETAPVRPTPSPGVLRIGCFGALRPLKNQLLQALAAIAVAEQRNSLLEFHINSTRIEQGGEPVLKNLRALFAAVSGHRLIEHEWVDHDDFLGLMATMDLSMQVSFTETFNIVSADAIAAGTPVAAGPEIGWLDPQCWAAPTDMESIVVAANRALDSGSVSVAQSKARLIESNLQALAIWEAWLVSGRAD